MNLFLFIFPEIPKLNDSKFMCIYLCVNTDISTANANYFIVYQMFLNKRKSTVMDRIEVKHFFKTHIKTFAKSKDSVSTLNYIGHTNLFLD